jgi:hypothetical protein
MHDLDRTTLELGEENMNFEFPEEFEFGQQETPFSEVEEEELAAQLLERFPRQPAASSSRRSGETWAVCSRARSRKPCPPPVEPSEE